MVYDIVVIGGGINGVGIALEAVTRGLSVLLCEKGDIGSGTSSKSSKLIHGGLRYLEQGAFGLVFESLKEREILLKNAGNLVHPLSLIIPYNKKHRAKWRLRLGLTCYELLAINSSLSHFKSINLYKDLDNPLNSAFQNGFQFYDCCVDDARLVMAVACQAKREGATILPRTKCIGVKTNSNATWGIQLKSEHLIAPEVVQARVVINATGPWLSQTLEHVIKRTSAQKIKQVKGSHIIVPGLYKGNQAYLLQNTDGRVVFVIPYLNQYTMIGTTDVPYSGDPANAQIQASEIDYLCKSVNGYLKRPIDNSQICGTWSGIRSLWDDGRNSLSKVTRDSHIEVQKNVDQPPLVNIFGGKLTTYRSLAEKTVDKLACFFPQLKKSKTRHLTLSGGMPHEDFAQFQENIFLQYPFVTKSTLKRLTLGYGENIHAILEKTQAKQKQALDLGHGLTDKEVQYLIQHEFALTVEDVLWRRTKLGLIFTQNQAENLDRWIKNFVNSNKVSH